MNLTDPLPHRSITLWAGFLFECTFEDCDILQPEGLTFVKEFENQIESMVKYRDICSTQNADCAPMDTPTLYYFATDE
eukprot:Awhi_evm1s4357